MTSLDPVEAIARAVLYEGYLLYPYRPSAIKNRLRWTIGGIHPRDSGEPWRMRVQCLVEGPAPEVAVELRYLELSPGDGWEEATERRLALPAGLAPMAAGPVRGESRVDLELLQPELHRLTVEVVNLSDLAPGEGRESWLPRTLASAHLVLRVTRGRFVSQTDPPADLALPAAACEQEGAWPVLVGARDTADTMLAAPIILEDFPRIAEESPGDLFDGTEIDEILTLRILTLTDAEKDEIRRTDARARELLERTEAMTAEQLMSLHGKMR